MFAVFLARPCPFYILDEVEAALDDINIDRFLELVARYSDRAQFIVVTHQKRTMDAADTLYGVSMGGDGVSRVVSRKLGGRDRGAGDRGRGGAAERRRPADWRAAGSELFAHRRTRRRRGRGATAEEPETARRFFRRLRENMSKTRQALGAELQATVFQSLDDEAFERLEETLIYADVGAPTTARDRRAARERGRGGRAPERRGPDPPAPRAAGRHGAPRRRHDRPAPGSPTVILDGRASTAAARPPRSARWPGTCRRSSGGRCCWPRATPSAPRRPSSSTMWAERAGCEIVRGDAGLRPGRGRLRRARGRARRAATTW